MKRIIAFTLLSIYVFCTAEAHQLVKIQLLLSHFLDQKHDQHSVVTFVEFLQIHYISENSSKNHHEEDARLPFKTIDDCCIACHNLLPIQPIVIKEPKYKLMQISFVNYNSGFYINSERKGIFQPPRS